MAAKMNNMHISNAFVTHSQEAAQSTSHTSSRDNSIEIEEIVEEEMMTETSNNNNDTMPSLYLSEELIQLKSTIEPLIPQAMLPRHLNSKALMIWTPRVNLWSETSHPTSPEAHHEDAEFIRSDDPKCSVVITEITDHKERSDEDDDMVMDDL